jgi:hypothetical protein
MAVTSITLTNPGAESTNTTGWTNVFTFVAATSAGAATPRTGSYLFYEEGASTSADIETGFRYRNRVYQDVAVPGGITAAVDAGTIGIKWAAWLQRVDTSPSGCLRVELYDGSGNLLWKEAYNDAGVVATASWVQLVKYYGLVPGTRTIRIFLESIGTSASNRRVAWDDATLDYSTAPATDWAATGKNTQLGLYAVANAPADEAIVNTLGIQLLANAETDNGLHDIILHQLGLYALAKRGGDRKEMRAWPFKQDDHEFYVLQLGTNAGTIVFDKLTGQWADWVSPGFDHWRGADGCNWAGIAVCGDTISGKLWKIDPEGRLDYETTPITSIIVGGMTERMRVHTPIYMAEVAVSEGEPADFAEGAVGITLRVGDGKGNWYDHGEGIGTDDNVTVRWYGLGLTQSPGTVFEITDTGYARRIDGLNVEAGGAPSDG